MNTGALTRHHVALERDYRDEPRVLVDRHRVLQILVNLIRNAKYACDESGRSDKRVILRIESVPEGVGIEVIDNGVGIPADVMERLFTHGFTTRKSGHGFGLHSASLAAAELGGTLKASSDGAGKGATFRLTLPLQPPEKRQ
jgi:signal transduction histidine kinase